MLGARQPSTACDGAIKGVSRVDALVLFVIVMMADRASTVTVGYSRLDSWGRPNPLFLKADFKSAFLKSGLHFKESGLRKADYIRKRIF